jgi:hypothetical protein
MKSRRFKIPLSALVRQIALVAVHHPDGFVGCDALGHVHVERIGGLGGIMDALHWKGPRMPLAYNRDLAAEAGAVGRLVRRLG